MPSHWMEVQIFAFLLICFGLSCLSSMQFNAFFVKKLTFPRIFFIVLAGSVGMIGILFAGLANKTLELALTLLRVIVLMRFY